MLPARSWGAEVLCSILRCPGRAHGQNSAQTYLWHSLGTESWREVVQCTEADWPCAPSTELPRALQWGAGRGSACSPWEDRTPRPNVGSGVQAPEDTGLEP